jgi:transposase
MWQQSRIQKKEPAVMENIITYIGIDTHKKMHQLAVRYPSSAEMTEFTITNTDREIKRIVKKIANQTPGEVRFCYEAGVCGFTLKRKIEAFGCKCEVIALYSIGKLL